MGAAREQRPSEKSLSEAMLSMRSIDKLIWLGKRDFVEDVSEYIEHVKSCLNEVDRKFKLEMNPPKTPSDLSFLDHPGPDTIS